MDNYAVWKGKLIYCEGYQCYVTTSPSGYFYYPYSGPDKIKNILIECNAGQCQTVPRTSQKFYLNTSNTLYGVYKDGDKWDHEVGYFINGGADAEDFPVIKCTDRDLCEKISREAMAETCADTEVGGISLEGVCIDAQNALPLEVGFPLSVYKYLSIPANQINPFTNTRSLNIINLLIRPISGAVLLVTTRDALCE